MGSNTTDEDVATALPVLSDLAERAKILLGELEQFRQHLRDLRQEGTVELAHFRGTIQAELSMLERLSKKPDNEATSHVARSSNLPFLENVWSTAKKSRRLTALQKRIYFNSPTKAVSQGMHLADQNQRKQRHDNKNAAVTVDAITNSGLTWTKVSLVTNKRLLFDLAKEGWQSEGSDDSDHENGNVVFGSASDDVDIPLVKSAKEFCTAAQSFRVKTRTPTVHIILPRVTAGETDEVDVILEQCRATGASLYCGEDLELAPPLLEAFSSMAPDPITTFSSTLNIDCTILLALVSEFSHAKVSKEPWFHKALQRQVEIEGNENLLPSLLYPALNTKRLVCTKEAAKRMREIVDTIGTPSEKARTAILMGDGNKTQPELIQELQQWSAHEVPEDWQIPILVVDQNEDQCQSNLPPEAASASANMTAINKSVFLYGWGSGNTTITSNRSVVKQIENDLEENFQNLDESVWPSVWLCPTARSLVGKEKRGAKKEDKKAGPLPLPDPLTREGQRRNGLDVLSTREGHEVEDLRPNGYPSEEVIQAKNDATRRMLENGTGTNAP